MLEATIANGCAHVPAGEWLVGRGQPTACLGSHSSRTLGGLFVPDRGAVRIVTSASQLWFATQERPFLTRFDAPADERLSVVSEKILLAPASSRVDARSVSMVPMSMRHRVCVTRFGAGWVVSATRSRVTRVTVADGETLSVRPDAIVAWLGNDPTGFCPKLGLLDLILPRGPRNLSLNFHGPCTVWFEGGCAAMPIVRGRRR